VDWSFSNETEKKLDVVQRRGAGAAVVHTEAISRMAAYPPAFCRLDIQLARGKEDLQNVLLIQISWVGGPAGLRPIRCSHSR
jgi:hypothetical protein